jgi:hypothetical protein
VSDMRILYLLFGEDPSFQMVCKNVRCFPGTIPV